MTLKQPCKDTEIGRKLAINKWDWVLVKNEKKS